MNLKLSYFALGFIAILFSYNTYNRNSNLIMESPSHPNEYSAKLINALLEEVGDNEFIVKGYKESGLAKYVIVEITGDDLHAEIPLAIGNTNNLAGIIRTKGVSYHGAELTGLQLSTVSDPIARFKIDQVLRVVD